MLFYWRVKSFQVFKKWFDKGSFFCRKLSLEILQCGVSMILDQHKTHIDNHFQKQSMEFRRSGIASYFIHLIKKNIQGLASSYEITSLQQKKKRLFRKIHKNVSDKEFTVEKSQIRFFWYSGSFFFFSY